MRIPRLFQAGIASFAAAQFIAGCSGPSNLESAGPPQPSPQRASVELAAHGADLDRHMESQSGRQSETSAFAAPGIVKHRREKSAVDLDPAADRWPTEVGSNLASQQLLRLAELIKTPDNVSPATLEPFVADSFRCTALRSTQKKQHRNDSAFLVERDEIAQDKGSIIGSFDFKGASGFATALSQILKSLAGYAPEQAKFKVVGVELSGNSLVTRQIFTLSARNSTGVIEQHAIWRSSWQLPEMGGLPRLQWIKLENREKVTSHSDHGVLFTDCTGSVLSDRQSYQEQLGTGIDHWLQRLEAMLTGPFGHHGISIGDANGDGLDDVYVCQPGGLPNMLLIQNEDGSASDCSQAFGVNLLDFTRSALFVDLDNNGAQDLVVTTMTQIIVFANDAEGRFSVRAKVQHAQDPHSITAADFDNDGRLDIYVCAYSGDGIGLRSSPTPIPIHDARNGGRNILLRNKSTPQSGPWTFDDATEAAGLNEANCRWSYAAAWEDYDDDGDVDLYVANDFGPNSLYRNDNGVFVDNSIQSGLGEAGFGMSVTWGDYDRDGLTDVYVSNMYSSAGNRITRQSQFQPHSDEGVRNKLRHAARGNSLFRNQGDGTFSDVSEDAGVTMGRWAWASLFSDIDNDGLTDLLVGNGFMSRSSSDDL